MASPAAVNALDGRVSSHAPSARRPSHHSLVQCRPRAEVMSWHRKLSYGKFAEVRKWPRPTSPAQIIIDSPFDPRMRAAMDVGLAELLSTIGMILLAGEYLQGRIR
jgi:hypothetical protein